jgi:hypothetical protein
MTTYTALGGGTLFIPSFTTGYTNLGPLPTTSFPADCLSSFWNMGTSALAPNAPTFFTQGCAVSTCCPSGNFYTDNFNWMTRYYSPGVCPSQYQSCSAPSLPFPTLSSAPGEIIIFCCPTNYACPQYTAPDIYLYCQSLLTAQSTPIIILDNLFDQKTVSISTWVNSNYPGGFYQVAYPIQVRLGDGTSISSTPHVLSSTSTPTTFPGSSSSTTAQPTPSTTSSLASNGSNGSGWSSPGVIAGCTITGIVISVIALIFAWRQCVYARRADRRRRH